MFNNIYKKFNNISIKHKKIIFVLLILISIILKASFFQIESNDFTIFLNEWLNHIKSNGNVSSLSTIYQSTNCNYYLPYLILLSIFSYLPLSNLIIIKLISIIFEFICCYFVFKTIYFFNKNKSVSLLIAISSLFIPSLIINGSMWGQCDIIFVSFIVMSLYFIICKDKNKIGLLLYFIALLFKLQAIFISPVYLIMLLCGKIKIKDMSYTILGLIIMFLLNFMIFGDFIYPLQMSYFAQTEITTFASLSIFATNLHWIIYYFGIVYTKENIQIVSLIFNIVFIISIFCTCLYFSKKIKNTTQEKNKIYYLVTACYGFICPFFMINMHERYFFILNILLLIIVGIFLNKQTIYLFISFIIVDLITLLQICWISNNSQSSLTNVFSPLILTINSFIILFLLYLQIKQTNKYIEKESN